MFDRQVEHIIIQLSANRRAELRCIQGDLTRETNSGAQSSCRRTPSPPQPPPETSFLSNLFTFSSRQFSDMRCSALWLVASWGLLVSVSGSPAVEKAYDDVVNLVSPGQQHLTSDSLRTVFNWLENRVHCGEVPCEKVSFIRATRSRRRRLFTGGSR